LHLPDQGLDKWLFKGLVCYGVKVTVRTFFNTKRDMYIYAGLFHKAKMLQIYGILHDKSKVVYTLLILYFGSEIGNWKKYKDVDALPNFKFLISSFDIGIQFNNTRFFEKSVN